MKLVKPTQPQTQSVTELKSPVKPQTNSKQLASTKPQTRAIKHTSSSTERDGKTENLKMYRTPNKVRVVLPCSVITSDKTD